MGTYLFELSNIFCRYSPALQNIQVLIEVGMHYLLSNIVCQIVKTQSV